MAKNGKHAPAQQNPQSVKQRLGPVKPDIKLGVIRFLRKSLLIFAEDSDRSRVWKRISVKVCFGRHAETWFSVFHELINGNLGKSAARNRFSGPGTQVLTKWKVLHWVQKAPRWKTFRQRSSATRGAQERKETANEAQRENEQKKPPNQSYDRTDQMSEWSRSRK